MIRFSVGVIPSRWEIEAGRELRRKIRSARKQALTEQARLIAGRAKALMPSARRTGAKSKPGEVPASRSGGYRRSIGYKVGTRGGFAVVGPRWPQGAHAGMLKHGTRFMKPRLVPVEVAYLETAPSRLTAIFSGKL
jgi:hypothetical protein